ncbi:MAG TPA: hypothetical protein ENN98_08660 [Desulfurivibrio alkaliphilus]|uniref:Uncharacterized protein n=1 Tax=Desulfurivibrio alkaliphilus TaxID=427923 RepID=A0A7C2XNK0_9BACT|nr:hypothetical protein [Desulfurivibrio alkaliphilus]
MEGRISRGGAFLLAFYLLLAGLWPVGAAAEQALTGRWTHLKGKDIESRDDYALSYTLDHRQELTEVMNLRGSLRYSRQWREQGYTEGVDPSLRFDVNNDLFLLDIQGSAGEQRNEYEAGRSRRNWGVNWSSAWQDRWLPRLRLSHARDYAFDHHTIRRSDTAGERSRAGVSWDLHLFQVHYNINRNLNRNKVTLGETTTTNQLARFETAGQFWDRRLSLGFSQQYTQNRNETVTAVGAGGFALIRQNIAQVLSGRDDTPLVTDDDELVSTPLLIDGDLETPAGIYTDGIDTPPLNIAVRMDQRRVDQLFLYTEEDAAGLAGTFVVDLYVSPNGTDYTRLVTNLPFNYDATERRFEFDLGGLNQQWLKLVVTTSPLPRVDFTEIEAYERVTSTDPFVTREERPESYLSDLNLAYRFSSSLGLTYNISLETGDYASGLEFDRRNQIAQLRWVPNGRVSSSLGFSENSEEIEGNPESVTRQYSLRVGTAPLPTVDTSLGLSRNERYEDSELQSTNHEAGLYTTAALYPDLDASLDLTWGRFEQEELDQVRDSLGSRLGLTARLVPRLTADLIVDYRHQRADRDSEALDGTLTLNWRVSDLFSFMSSAGKKWQEWEGTQESLLLRMTMAPTDTIQFSLSYQYNEDTETTNRYSVNGSWAIDRLLTFQANASYTERAEVSDWQARTQLTARFAGR